MVKLFMMYAIISGAWAHEAHVHGQAHVSIAFDGKSGKIEIKAPTESIYGFEHNATSAKDKKNKDLGLKKLEEKVAEMIAFDPNLKCVINKEMDEIDQRGNHSSVTAEFKVKCEVSPAGTNITFAFQKSFPKLKKVDVDILLEGIQKSMDVTKNGESIELK